MDSQLQDPTDWSGTPLAPLESIDALLRCQICKDFYSSAVLTNCSHTFCSLCIRRCLSVDGKCPSCRAPEQEARLRRNGVLQELVDAFVAQRDGLLKASRESSASDRARSRQPADQPKPNTRSKRKRQEDDAGEEPPSRRTRSRRTTASQNSHATTDGADDNHADAIVVVDSDEEYTPQSGTAPNVSPNEEEKASEDGLVACPSCGKRMKEEYVFTHLDNCTGEPDPAPQPSATPITTAPPEPTPARLPHLPYGMLKDNALRKKLNDLKIPASGPRSLLIRRHGEWLALWNANCDSNHPRSKQALLKELDAWERSQGGRSANGGVPGEGIKGKEFESTEYSRKHETEFADLIAQAKASRLKKTQAKEDDPNPPSAQPDPPENNPPQPQPPPEPQDPHSTSVQAASTAVEAPSTAADAPSTPAQAPPKPTHDPAPSTTSTTAPPTIPPEDPYYRRGATAPPATGPLKVSQSLTEDAIPAPAPAPAPTLPDPPPPPPLRHVPSAPATAPARSLDSPPRAAAAAVNAHQHGPRRPSLSQAHGLPAPLAPAALMFSGGAAGAGSVRTLPMFQVSAEAGADAEDGERGG